MLQSFGDNGLNPFHHFDYLSHIIFLCLQFPSFMFMFNCLIREKIIIQQIFIYCINWAVSNIQKSKFIYIFTYNRFLNYEI